jgi:hypothetical protein
MLARHSLMFKVGTRYLLERAYGFLRKHKDTILGLLAHVNTSVTCTINILLTSNDTSRIVIDDSRVMLQIKISLTDDWTCQLLSLGHLWCS